jgi:hypothetical protein
VASGTIDDRTRRIVRHIVNLAIYAAAVVVIALTALALGPQGPWPGRGLEAFQAPGDPGVPAPAAVVAELQSTLMQARQRFEARDVPGVLAHVSDQYRTGPFTKPVIREQLNAITGVYDAVRAPIRIDHVQMVGDHAWVYSTGEISGRLRVVGTWVVLYSWQRELEVARREAGGWRLFGYQQ